MIQFICTKNSHSLEKLYVDSQDDEAFDYLPLCHNLKHFKVTEANRLTKKTLENLSKLNNLESVGFIYSTIDAESFNWFFENTRLSNLKSSSF